MHWFCPSVRLSIASKKAIFSKSKQFRAMTSIDDLEEDPHGVFKESIIGFLKFGYPPS